MQTLSTTPQNKVTQNSLNAAPRRVLCVEDDRDTCEVLRFVMTEFEFTSVHSIGSAKQLIDAGPFDLYILDNWLPDGSGVDLCAAIREVDENAPIIFTSAIGQRKDIDDAMKAGADRYLVKPYEPETLVRAVKELLEPSGNLAFES